MGESHPTMSHRRCTTRTEGRDVGLSGHGIAEEDRMGFEQTTCRQRLRQRCKLQAKSYASNDC